MGFSAGLRAKATACSETEAGSVAEIQVGTEGLVSRFGRCASATGTMLEEASWDICPFVDIVASRRSALRHICLRRSPS